MYHRNPVQKIGNPTKALVSLSKDIKELLQQLNHKIEEVLLLSLLVCRRSWLYVTRPAFVFGCIAKQASKFASLPQCEGTQDIAHNVELDNGETLRLMHSRWEKLYNDLWDDKKKAFDMSKIPDVYDCCKYDAIHTQRILGRGTSSGTVLQRMYATARSLAEFVCPSEYGLSRSQRLNIGCTICRNLVEKIGRDMKSSVRGYLKSAIPKAAKKKTEDEADTTAVDVSSDSDDETSKLKLNREYLEEDVNEGEDDFVEDSIKTRVYFTSESHLHTVVSALRFINVQGIAGEGGKAKKSKGIFDSDEQKAIDNIPEFDYLTQIVFKVYLLRCTCVLVSVGFLLCSTC
jgi:inositol hexakisphosphate/diphosphoinositol-pentakisphosphate kinase